MHNFFITGLPRTRSSWLANFFTIGNTYCYHELGNKHNNTLAIRDELMSRPEEYTGIADSMLPFYYQPLADTLRDQRLVIIQRPINQVLDSMRNFFRNQNVDMKMLTEILEKAEKKIRYLKEHFEKIIVPFKDLDDPEVVEHLWYYCVPGVEFDRERWEMLNNLKVEPYMDKWLKNLNKENVQELMEAS